MQDEWELLLDTIDGAGLDVLEVAFAFSSLPKLEGKERTEFIEALHELTGKRKIE